MLADTILILFISMATALLSEGKYLVLKKKGKLGFSTVLKVKLIILEACLVTCSKIMIPVHVKCPHELLLNSESFALICGNLSHLVLVQNEFEGNQSNGVFGLYSSQELKNKKRES